MADEKELVVSLALKQNGYKSEISKITKQTKLMEAEFERVKSASDDFEESLEGQEKKLELLSKTLENARKKVDIYTEEVSKCEKVLEETTRAYQKQQEEVQDLETQLERAKTTYGETSQEVKNLESELTKAQKALKTKEKAVISADNALMGMRTTLNKAETNANKLGNEIRQTESHIEQFDRETGELKRSLQELSEELIDATDEAVAFGGHMSEIGQGIADVGSAVGEVGQQIVESLKEANDIANEFNENINILQASTGATKEEMAEMEGVVASLYTNNWGEDWNDVATSVATVNKTLKLTDDKLEAATEKAIGIRDVFGYDVQETVRAVDTLMKQFGLTSDEAFNLITQGSQNGLDFSGELLDTINEYSVQFYDAGLNAEDMFAILENGVNNGAINLDKIADSVKEFSIRLTDGSETSAEALDKLGFNAEDVADKMSAGGDEAKTMYQEVVQALYDVDDAQQQNLIATDLFGTTWEDLGADVVTNLYDIEGGYDKAKTSAEELNDVISDTTSSRLETLGRTIEDSLVKPLGESLNPLLEQVMPYVESIVNHIGKWIENNPQLASTLVIIVGAIGGFLAVLGPMITTIGMLVITIGALTTMFATAGGFAAFFSAAILPIIAVIGGVIAVVVILAMSIKENWEGIKLATSQMLETVKPYFEQFKESFSGLWDTCKSIYDTVIQPLFMIIGQIIAELIIFAGPLFGALLTIFSAVFDTISIVWNTIGQPIFAALISIIQKVWEFFQPIFRQISELFTEVVNGISSVWNNVLKPVFEFICEVVGDIGEVVGDVFSFFADVIIGAMEDVLQPIQWVIDKLSDLFGWIADVGNNIGSFLDKINPFKSLSSDYEVNARMSDVQVPDAVALSGAYYTPQTRLGNSVSKLAGEINSVQSTPINVGANTEAIEKILDDKLSKMIDALTGITLNANVVTNLDGRKLSDELDIINGRNMNLYRRFN